jgi:indole-3-glycerol phosphate synthase
VNDFLAKVTAASVERANAGKRARPESELRAVCATLPPARSLLAALSAPGRRFLAEVKRASPSRGDIGAIVDPAALAAQYEAGGAAAISVLTEPAHFKGSLDDLRAVRANVSLPVLRKDFLVDPWQAWEARASGADAALLIAAALPGERLREMAAALAGAGLEALLEVHDEAELEIALASGAPVVGVNARSLRTLEVDLAVAERLGARIPRGVLGVAESGIKTKADVDRLANAGFRAFLVGEALVASGNPSRTLQEWHAA